MALFSIVSISFFLKRFLPCLIAGFLVALGTSQAFCIERMPEPNPPHIELPTDTIKQILRQGSGISATPTVEWTFHKTADNAHPNDNEQQMLWLMNRARSNPTNEGVWLATTTDSIVASARSYFNVNLNLLKSEFAALSAKPPAAFDVRLYNAAYAHSQNLIARDAQDHSGQWDLITNAGFAFFAARGNVFSYADNALHAHSAFNIDWGYGSDGSGMQDTRGHRKAIMAIDGDYTNVGLAMIQENNTATNVGPFVVTGNFCDADTGVSNHYNRFLVGTVWEDINSNGQYDPGEGKGGIQVRPEIGTYFAITSNSGGYAIPMTTEGTFSVTFSGAAIPSTVTKTAIISSASVMLDVIVERITKNSQIDFNTDGKPDILWRNKATGGNYLWYMNGVSKISGGALQTLADTNWTIVGVGDFNSDSKPDIIWRNSATGQNAVWYMNGATKTSAEYLATIADTNWTITGIGDFNSNGMPDILWSNTATGQNRIWYMMGATKSSSEELPPVADRNWAMVGVGDFNSDGMPDILWSHRSSGQNYVWYMNGAKRTGGNYLQAIANLKWEVVGVDDFNSDGKPDVLWRNKSTGENYLWYMNGATKTGGEYIETWVDTNWKIVN